MNEPTDQQVTAVRTVRFVHRFLLLMVPLYAFVAERVRSSAMPPREIDGFFLLAIGAAVAAQIAIAAFFRQTKVLPAQATLQAQPNNAEALKNWTSNSIVVFVLCESIALFGFVLRFLGAPRARCLALYVTALVLLFLWRPKLETYGLK
jgi:hypothetical protein